MDASRLRAPKSRILSDGTFIVAGTEYVHLVDGATELDITVEDYESRLAASHAPEPVSPAVSQPSRPRPQPVTRPAHS